MLDGLRAVQGRCCSALRYFFTQHRQQRQRAPFPRGRGVSIPYSASAGQDLSARAGVEIALLGDIRGSLYEVRGLFFYIFHLIRLNSECMLCTIWFSVVLRTTRGSSVPLENTAASSIDTGVFCWEVGGNVILLMAEESWLSYKMQWYKLNKECTFLGIPPCFLTP